jgi:hypothetical protein
MSIFTYLDVATSDNPTTVVTPHAVNHREGCTAGKTGWPDTSMTELTPSCVAAGCTVGYIHESHRGLVVSLRERNGYDDSDFFAVVLDRSTGFTTEVFYATTRGWTYFNNAVVDLPDDERKALDARVWARSVERQEDRAKREAEFELKVPKIGRVVRVVKGRKVPIGVEGKVVWFGRSSYARQQEALAFDLRVESERLLDNAVNYRVGLRLADGSRVFTAASNVVVLPESLAFR